MIDDPRWIMLALGTITFVLVVLVVLVVLLGLRRGSGGDTGDILEADIREADAPGSSTRWIVGGGVVLPTLVIVVVLIATVGERRRVDAGVGTGPDGRPASSAI